MGSLPSFVAAKPGQQAPTKGNITGTNPTGVNPWGHGWSTEGEAQSTPTPVAKTMAYQSGQPAPNAHVISQLHRLRRGITYLRAGVVQPPIPQFKGLTITTQANHLPTAANPALRAILPPAFRQNQIATRVRWTTSNIPNVVTP